MDDDYALFDDLSEEEWQILTEALEAGYDLERQFYLNLRTNKNKKGTE